MSDTTFSVPMSIKSCRCGTVYAIPACLADYHCPACAVRAIKGIREERDNAQSGWFREEKKVYHLKGVITRMKNTRMKNAQKEAQK